MSNEIAIFENAAFGNVRVIMRRGEPWFVAKDVADALGYENISRDIQRHCKHAELFKSTETVPLDIPTRGLLLVPESDVYRLIMRSRLPAAEAFQDWITEEVIPSIRKHGGYGIAQSSGVHELGRAMTGILERLDAIEARNDRLMSKIEGDFHFVQKGKVFERDPNCMDMGEACNFLRQRFGIKIGSKQLFDILRKHGFIHKRRDKKRQPTQKGLANGLKEDWRQYRFGAPYYTTIITRKGLTKILELLGRRQQQTGMPGIVITSQIAFEE